MLLVSLVLDNIGKRLLTELRERKIETNGIVEEKGGRLL